MPSCVYCPNRRRCGPEYGNCARTGWFPSRSCSTIDWSALQQRIRARYSMPEEIEMFEAVLLRGLSVEEAIRGFMEKMNRKSDDIELF